VIDPEQSATSYLTTKQKHIEKGQDSGTGIDGE
jgi:hypothetical protein